MQRLKRNKKNVFENVLSIFFSNSGKKFPTAFLGKCIKVGEIVHNQQNSNGKFYF